MTYEWPKWKHNYEWYFDDEPDDVYELKQKYDFTAEPYDMRGVAEEVADYIWSNMDGWEYMADHWRDPVIVWVRKDWEEYTKFAIYTEMVPEHRAEEVKEK